MIRQRLSDPGCFSLTLSVFIHQQALLPESHSPNNSLKIDNMDYTPHYRGKRVLVTGHTGFKGSWLTQWLLLMGAEVYGYALAPDNDPALFDQLEVASEITHKIGDIRDKEGLKAFIAEARPDIIFHMAAQPLVRYSYDHPLETVEVNTLGTAYVMEAVRQLGLPTVIIAITTDKSYSNQEWLFGYRENDPMGGYDVYSSSKGAAELLIDSWRNSFFHPSKVSEHGVYLASTRAGNVIGGGDWATDRIVPDCVRALKDGQVIEVRSPRATRPWQHVLEPLSGYLQLGAVLLDPDIPDTTKATYCSGFNFGPIVTSNQPVQTLVTKIIDYWGDGEWQDTSDPNAVHEASLLQLTIEKAYHMLNWFPRWDFDQTVKYTVGWYREVLMAGASPKQMMVEQIAAYEGAEMLYRA